MARGHIDLPIKGDSLIISKKKIFEALQRIDGNKESRERVLKIETGFRKKIDSHLLGLPTAQANFQKFNTSPFVLLFYSKKRGYTRVSEIESDIIPAKIFSSMETSAGRMVEEVVLPVYGWEVVPSKMHSVESLLDGRKSTGDNFCAVTLKSGPRCLNDEMAQNIGRDVAHNVAAWAKNHDADTVDFTYGVLYGTKAISNKKDWHVLRSIAEALPVSVEVVDTHKQSWKIRYRRDGLDVSAAVRIGIDWWTYLGDEDTWLELCIALIRACVAPAGMRTDVPNYAISDLASILDLSSMPKSFNVSLIQESQMEWLLFICRHFCDGFKA
jgi:hypothetical protein